MTEVHIQDVGPITDLRIPLPDGGGIVRLVGRNGAGKTKALEAAESLLGADRRLDARDGKKRGEVDGFGVTLKIGRSTRRTGDAEVTSLEGRLDLAELVDPGLKSPAAADAKRIKALVAITGVTADRSLFYDITGGKGVFDKLIPPQDGMDLLGLAGHVKRCLELHARAAEGNAQNEKGKAQACREAAEGVPTDVEKNSAALHGKVEACLKKQAAIEGQEKLADKDKERQQEAERRFNELTDVGSGPTVVDVDAQFKEAERSKLEFEEKVAELENAVQKARMQSITAGHLFREATALLKAARDRDHVLDELKRTIGKAVILSPGPAALEDAADLLSIAQQNVEHGTRARDAIASKQNAKGHDAARLNYSQTAERLRNSAAAVDGVLSDAIDCESLRVEGGRLITDTVRGTTPFAELSHGERWKLAIDLALTRLAHGGIVLSNALLVIPQSAWEGLDPEARSAVHQHAVKRQVAILTAEPASGELEARVYQDTTSQM